ncbi:MAG: acetate--CoA ligase [archaeon]|nr:acetate--CoA ligase [archaeon]MCR4323712.1 acetate--CoA ligase [Nanoarchaeota archaeon]
MGIKNKSKAKKYVVKKGGVFWPSPEMKKIANMADPKIYEKAAKNPIKFWEDLAWNGLTWEKKWDKGYVEHFPYFEWFKGGQINFSVNCIDRHLDHGDRTALIWVPEPTNEKPIKVTYRELYDKVNKFANVLKSEGVKKGDVVSIYLPMVPEAAVAMLACARIGAIHSVVFSAFSADALRARIIGGEAKILITSDGYFRRGKPEPLLAKAKKAAKRTTVKRIIVVNRIGKRVWGRRYLDFNKALEKAEAYCEPEIMKSEDPLFILYTSGTTGKPKGVVHDTGGYAIQAYQTSKWNFNLNPGDVMWCTADVGWITGHTYAFYGPFLTGATSLIYEGGPDYPNSGRWWKIIQDHDVNVFYTAPTAVRMFMKVDPKWINQYDLSSIKILGTVGEPIDKESWMWYFRMIGGSRCPVIDTWWQTETGGTLINVLPGIGPFVPTVSGRSFPGLTHVIVDDKGKPMPTGRQGFLAQKSPFAPGMLHGVWKNPEKYVKTYWSNFKNMYDTSDGAYLVNGLIRITGRTDDVMKVAGHRLATAELENAIHDNKKVGDVAVVPMPHDVKGQVPIAFVVLKKGDGSEKLENELKKHVDKKIGPTARPGKIFFVKDLPKTRSGKIMRRILKALLVKEKPEGLMTLVNPESVEEIKTIIER